MVSFGAFWVAISYRLAACFTRIGSTCGIEIYWRSIVPPFWELNNYSLRKMTKMGQKLIKLHKNCVVFGTFSVLYSLKIFAGGGLSELRPTVALSTPLKDAIVFKAPVLPVMVNGGRFERWWHVDCDTNSIDGMLEDICYIIHVILCNDMIEVRWDIWLSLYCKLPNFMENATLK